MSSFQFSYIAHNNVIYRFERKTIPEVCYVDDNSKVIQLAPGAKVANVEIGLNETWNEIAWKAILTDVISVLENMQFGGENIFGREFLLMIL